MFNLYSNQHNDPKFNAQRNLQGLTHYVDDDTLRYHKARILRSGALYNGLIFWLIESVSLDYNNTKRGFRYVLFDTFGTVISRVSLEDSYKTHEQAKKAMWEAINNIDEKAITLEAIETYKRRYLRDSDEFAARVNKIGEGV